MRQNTSTSKTRDRIVLYRKQREAVKFLTELDGFAGLFAEMGSGKTPITLSYYAKRNAEQHDVKRLLIVCPLSVGGVWRNEIQKVGLPWNVLVLTTGSVERSAKRLNELPRDDDNVQVVIVNYDAYWRYPAETRKIKNRQTGEVVAVRQKLRGLRRAILRWRPDAIVADEVQRLKGRTTKQAKFAHELRMYSWLKSALGLSGTPIIKGIEDLFSIFKFIDPTVFGTAWGDFDRRYILRGGFGGYQIKGYARTHEVDRKLKRKAFQMNRSDIIELPPRVSTIVPVQLETKARKVYDTMRKESIVKLETPGPDGRPLHGTALASIVLTSLIRLRQITGGTLPVSVEGSGGHPDSVVMADVGNEKLKTAVELTNDALANDQRVVIFAEFTRDIARLVGAFPHHYRDGERGCVYCNKPIKSALHLKPTDESYVSTIAGNVPVERREQRIEALRSGKLRVLIVQLATGSVGIDLTAANVAIFYSVDYSLGNFLQARDRLYRHGQTKTVLEYLLQVEDSIDEDIFAALMSKQDIARKVTSLDYAKNLISGKARGKRAN